MRAKSTKRCLAWILALVFSFGGIFAEGQVYASEADMVITGTESEEESGNTPATDAGIVQDGEETTIPDTETDEEEIIVPDIEADGEEDSTEKETTDNGVLGEADPDDISLEEEDQEDIALDDTVREEEADDDAETEELLESEQPGVEYQAHVARTGWQDPVFDGTTAGTMGQACAIEALYMNLTNVETDELAGSGIEYNAHVQSIGWMNPVRGGELIGTVGKSKRIEAVTINLTGPIAEEYDIYYRAYIQTHGWLGWASDGAKAGSMGYGKRLEALEVRLVKKGEEAPGSADRQYLSPRITYQAHSQSIGWQGKVSDDELAGSVGRAKRLEALKIELPEPEYAGGIVYRAHVQSEGWQEWRSDGQVAGTSGMSRRIEAIEIALTGEMAEHYDVYYSVHMAKIGWSDYVANGETAGSTGLSKRIEAIKIQLVRKETEGAPSQGGVRYVRGFESGDFFYSGQIRRAGSTGYVQQGNTMGAAEGNSQLQHITLHLNRADDGRIPAGAITYSTHVSGRGWIDWVENGNASGSPDDAHGLEAVKIALSGDLANYYDIYYRACIEDYGWLGWAMNGQAAGSTGCSYRLEALQIRLVSKDAGKPGANADYYTETKKPKMPQDQQDMLARANLYSSMTPYLLMVNRDTHRVGIFQGSLGNWEYVYYWPCSDGAPSTPTVTGEFTVQGKGMYFDSGAARCYWYTQFYGNYLFHSVLYNKDGSLMDGRLGMGLSHGCVRLQIDNAKWIYDNIPRGSKVVVY